MNTEAEDWLEKMDELFLFLDESNSDLDVQTELRCLALECLLVLFEQDQG